MEDCQEQCQPTDPEMKTYIGCKVIQAKPMDHHGFLARKGRPVGSGGECVPENAPGYLVQYPDGYESWSPAHIFDEAYRLINRHELAMCR